MNERERKNYEIIGRSLFCMPYYFVDNLLLTKLFFNGLLLRKKKSYFINDLLLYAQSICGKKIHLLQPFLNSK